MEHTLPEIRRRSIDALDEAILRLSARMEAACYEQLVLIREFDERAGWLEWQSNNCSEWLSWRCDISLSAAREKVRVAHALLQLPNISQAFAEGRLSYTKVRALTRVTHLRNERELLRFACKHSARQVEERCREFRCGTADSTEAANRVHERRYLSLHRHPRRGTVTVSMEVSLEEGELLEKALDVAREHLLAEGTGEYGQAELATESWSSRQADALIAMARAYLDGEPAAERSRANYQVTVHVDRSALIEGRGRSGLPIESVRRIACDAETVTIVEDENEQPLSVGRKTRTIPPRLNQALWARDKGCTFPGCHRRRFVDGHHVRHWAQGGETSLGNLLLLCTRHHRAVHEGGFTIRKDFQNNWRFFRPDGIAVPDCGYIGGDEQGGKAGLSLATLIRAAANPSARGVLPKWKVSGTAPRQQANNSS
jgi:hypothetical protein